MGKIFKFRKPRLRMTKKGPKLSGGGMSVGGKNAKVNFSKSGASLSAGAGKARYNSRRGWSMGCVLPIVTLLVTVVVLAVVAI